jgi:hypothetical protein
MRDARRLSLRGLDVEAATSACESGLAFPGSQADGMCAGNRRATVKARFARGDLDCFLCDAAR